MSRDRDYGQGSSPWSNYQQQGAAAPLGVSTELDPGHNQNQQGRNPYSAPPTNSSRLPDRPPLPARSSTVGTPDPDRNLSANNYSFPKARSEDLNHDNPSSTTYDFHPSSSPRPSPPFLSSASGASRPNTPGASAHPKDPSSSGHSDHSHHPNSVNSHSVHSEASTSHSKPPPSPSSTSTSLSSS